MVWTTLGTLTPTLNWASLNTPVLGGELFRVQQAWAGDYPGSGYLQFSAFYADAGRYGYASAGFNKDYQIIRLPIPQVLEAAGFTARYIAVRHNTRARLYSNANWSISVEQWIG